jgi:hypothetical protein
LTRAAAYFLKNFSFFVSATADRAAILLDEAARAGGHAIYAVHQRRHHHRYCIATPDAREGAKKNRIQEIKAACPISLLAITDEIKNRQGVSG